MPSYPQTRMRRLRRHEWTRRLVAENTLTASDLIWPIFVIEGENKREAVASMPGAARLTVDLAVQAAREAAGLSIPVIALFPFTDPKLKSEDGREAVNAGNLICRAVRAIKQAVPEIGILCDVALDPYTSHGHDGLIRDGDVHNDSTIEVLVQQALVQTAAGADIIAPSDMMDGRVGAIRAALEKHGHHNTLIMAYAAKYGSAFYGPFRDAVGSSQVKSAGLKAGDKRSYQMDPANGDEALREVALDLEEGADIIMVKPALPYLDVIQRVRERFDVPVGAYNVSGEYSMVKAAARNGWIDEKRVVLEILTGIQRAGADIILTYHAKDAAKWLRNC